MRHKDVWPWSDESALAALDTAAIADTAQTRARNACAGDTTSTGELPLHRIEADLAEADGLRVQLQAEARRQLLSEAQPLIRATVLETQQRQDAVAI